MNLVIDQKFLDVVYSCLLHDIGKVSGRAGFSSTSLDNVATSRRKAHGNNGADFLQELIATRSSELELSDCIEEHQMLLEAVRLHMARERKSYYQSGNTIDDSHILWIVDKADNIAAGTDRRDDLVDEDDFDIEISSNPEQNDSNHPKWQQKITLRDVFDVFKDGHTTRYFKPQMLNDENVLGFPEDENVGDDGFDFTTVDYSEILNRMKKHIQGLNFHSSESVRSLLNLLESTCTFIPSSTNADEVADISLYDHLKLTAAVGSAMYYYAKVNDIENLHDWTHSDEFLTQNIFRLVSFDISGIQDFIYTIASSVTVADQYSASTGLRARSFYLELMTEHLVDELLEFIGLTRSNLLYAGGGHAYLIVQNTQDAKTKLQLFEDKANQFFLQEFDIALYIAVGSEPFSAKTITKGYGYNGYKYDPEEYRKLYKSVSKQISEKKLHRYSSVQIGELNSSSVKDGRECKICHRIGKNSEDEMCKVCNGLQRLSKYVQSDPRGKNNGWFIVTTNPKERILELPSIVQINKVTHSNDNLQSNEENAGRTASMPKYLDFIGGKYQAIEELDQCVDDKEYIRLYAKNKFTTGVNQATRLLVGDYTSRDLMSGQTEDIEQVKDSQVEESDATTTFRTGSAISFEKMAKRAQGIERIAVLRADVDDLGAAFMSGFAKQGSPTGLYNTISRSATFSRSMSLFFKYHLNWMLAHPRIGVLTRRSSEDFLQLTEDFGGRIAQIIYSGGDDLFIVGAWNDVIEFAMELQEEFAKWTNRKLTLSAGIGLFHGKASISQMAKQTGLLEGVAKDNGKDSVALFLANKVFKWDEFVNNVMGEKYQTIQNFFKNLDIQNKGEEYGKAFVYKLLGLLRETNQTQTGDFTTISMAHWVYFLTRMEPKGKLSDPKYQVRLNRFREFTEKLNHWINNQNDRSGLELALELYVYTIRNNKIKESNNGK